MTTPTFTFKLGDRVRLVRDTPYGAKKGAEFTITHISSHVKPDRSYAVGAGYPGGAWLADLELVERPKFASGGYVHDLSESNKRLLSDIAKTTAVQVGYIKQVATLGEQPGIRDRHIANIQGLQKGVAHRNTTIERQKAQLAEYAAELEQSRSYAEALRGFGAKDFIDGIKLVELGAAAQQLAIDTPEKLVQLVKDARYVPIGKKGYEEGLKMTKALANIIAKAPDGRPVEEALRDELGKWMPIQSAGTPHSPITADIAANILRDLQKRIGEANAAKGFHEEGEKLRKLRYSGEGPHPALRNYAVARLALITTEVAEAIEEIRAGRAVDETYYPTREALLQQKGGEILAEGASSTIDAALAHPHKPEGVPSELADIVIRAFDFAHEFDIDLSAMINEKLAYNQTRGHKHGKVM